MGLPGRITSVIIMYASFLLGGLSLLLLMIFLFMGGIISPGLGMGTVPALLFNASLSMIFFLQHSIMVRRSFKDLMARFMNPLYLGAIYSIASGISLLLLVFLWQKTGSVIASPDGPVRMLWRSLFFLSLAGFAWGALSLRMFDPFGIGAIARHLRGKTTHPVPFTVKGPYHFMRHPLYSFFIMLIWSSPDLTAERLLFNLLWTFWIIIGSFLEERDLVDAYGDDYRKYREKVPMFVPYRGRRV